MKAMVEALKEGRAYDHISNNGYAMSKDDLVRIIKEYDYAIHRLGDLKTIDSQEVYDEIAEELSEFIYDDED